MQGGHKTRERFRCSILCRFYSPTVLPLGYVWGCEVVDAVNYNVLIKGTTGFIPDRHGLQSFLAGGTDE